MNYNISQLSKTPKNATTTWAGLTNFDCVNQPWFEGVNREITNETFNLLLDKIDKLEKSMSEKIDELSAIHYLIGLFSGTNKG